MDLSDWHIFESKMHVFLCELLSIRTNRRGQIVHEVRASMGQVGALELVTLLTEGWTGIGDCWHCMRHAWD